MIEVRGAEGFGQLARALRKAGEKDLQRELSRAVTQSVKPFKASAQASARATLPQRGGLADDVAKSAFRTRRRTGRNTAGVRITAKNRYILGRLNRGVNRHPVFPDTSTPRDEWTWVDQPIPAGWWDRPRNEMRPRIAREMDAAMKRIVVELERRAKQGGAT